MSPRSLRTYPDLLGGLRGSPHQKTKHLGLSAGARRLAIPLLRFAEVRDLTGVTPVMSPPDYRCGHTVIYGRAVLLLDLRVEFEQPAPFDQGTRVVFAWRRVDGATESQVGLIVDAVDTVLEVDEEGPAPRLETGHATQTVHILEIAGAGNKPRVLVDLDRLIVS